MTKNKFYQYKKCSTCTKARKFLDQHSVAYTDVDIVENPPTKAELKFMLEQYGGELKKLFNTSGQVYRQLNIKEKLKSMTSQEAIDLLAQHGKLIKRPFLVAGKQGLVGFKEEEWQQLLR